MVAIVKTLDEIKAAGTGKKAVVVDFFATWCPSCKIVQPSVERLAGELVELAFVKVDVDASEDLAEKFEADAVPTFVVVDPLSGESKGKYEGADEARLRELIRCALP